MPSRFKFLPYVLFISIIAVFAGCSALKQIQDSLTNLKRLQFKLDSVAPGNFAGVNLAVIDSPSRLSLADGLKLANAFRQKSLPLSMTLNVAAKNPNDGTGGAPQRTALLRALAWTLRIDDQETISGDIPNPIEIPGVGQATVIPLQMSLDLYKFFGDRGYDSLLNLALAIAGQQGSTSRITLSAVPTVSVAGIDLPYPGQIEIVDKEFTNP